MRNFTVFSSIPLNLYLQNFGMNKHSLILLTILLVLASAFTIGRAHAQKNKDSATIANITALVKNQAYTFKAQTATPLSGRLRQLNSDYNVQVSKDEVISQLPYFGRAYSAPINTADAGIQFTSKDFEYSITDKKKGGWDVAIKFKDAKGVQLMQMSIFNNGSASLQVISNTRQSISFNGYVTASDPKKK